MKEVWIVAAKRSAQGKFLGALARQSAVDLAVAVGHAVLADIPVEKVDQVIVGNVLSAGSGMNVARQIAVKLGLPLHVPAFTVNMMCASGLQAAILGAQAIRAGDARVVLCGGTESMSRAPYLLDRARSGYKFGDGVLVDSLLRDGLVDAFSNESMGLTAERLAGRFGIDRYEQDAFAAKSHRRHFVARDSLAGEIVPIAGLDHDEHARPDTTVEKLGMLKPAFSEHGTVTAGNASGMNDGAALLVLCDRETAVANRWSPLASLTGSVVVGCDPQLMGLGPAHATRRLCEQLGCLTDSFDAIELNEAFAAQVIACMRELRIDPARVNTSGGAIAMGHPIGASGARILVHLAHQIATGKVQRGLATLCVGGGMGAAAALGRA
jgi:acetyl-CoA C-acetyltransferase